MYSTFLGLALYPYLHLFASVMLFPSDGFVAGLSSCVTDLRNAVSSFMIDRFPKGNDASDEGGDPSASSSYGYGALIIFFLWLYW